jgi:hypothetical protein
MTREPRLSRSQREQFPRPKRRPIFHKPPFAGKLPQSPSADERFFSAVLNRGNRPAAAQPRERRPMLASPRLARDRRPARHLTRRAHHETRAVVRRAIGAAIRRARGFYRRTMTDLYSTFTRPAETFLSRGDRTATPALDAEPGPHFAKPTYGKLPRDLERSHRIGRAARPRRRSERGCRGSRSALDRRVLLSTVALLRFLSGQQQGGSARRICRPSRYIVAQ